MILDHFKTVITHILCYSNIPEPLKGQIQISVNVPKKVFSFAMPIFTPFGPMPRRVAEYVSKRRNLSFKPHSTSFQKKDDEILLVQEIPFHRGCQDSLRQSLTDFWKMAERCHRMLKEIAAEDKIPRIDSYLEE